MNLVQNWSWELKPRTDQIEAERKRNAHDQRYVRTEDREPRRRGFAPKPAGYMSPEFRSHCDRLVASVTKGRTFLRSIYPHRDKNATRLIAWARTEPHLTVGLGYPGPNTMGRPSVYVELAADRTSAS